MTRPSNERGDSEPLSPEEIGEALEWLDCECERDYFGQKDAINLRKYIRSLKDRGGEPQPNRGSFDAGHTDPAASVVVPKKMLSKIIAQAAFIRLRGGKENLALWNDAGRIIDTVRAVLKQEGSGFSSQEPRSGDTPKSNGSRDHA